jgi:hypothetical protein
MEHILSAFCDNIVFYVKPRSVLGSSSIVIVVKLLLNLHLQ